MSPRLEKMLYSPWVSGSLLGGMLLLSLPMMLCMAMTADPILYDLQAKCVLDGGVLYRDIVEPNLPGIVWLHMLIRTLFGWSLTALKVVDLVIVTGIVYLLVRWHKSDRSENNSAFLSGSLFLSLILYWFYFGTSEWCHCQRDTWMMLPALFAFGFRRIQIERLSKETPFKTLFGASFLEGCIWAIAFWIKPFIAVPALVVMALGAVIAYRNGTSCRDSFWKKVGIDFSGILFGGVCLGGIGIIWLLQTGTWAHFWEMALRWNPTYFEIGRERWTLERLWNSQVRFLPFSPFHLIAIPLSVSLISNLIRHKASVSKAEKNNVLLAGLYLGWLFQSITMQHLFDYVHVPPILLALTLVLRNASSMIENSLERIKTAVSTSQFEQLPSARSCSLCGAILLIGLAIPLSPATQWNRIQYWGLCVTEGPTPEVKTGLQHFPLPNWNQLEPALDFLRELGLRDGELTVHNVHLVHVYQELEIKPSTRFVYLDVLTRIFHRDHSEEIVEQLDHSGHRYVLSNLIENGHLLPEPKDENRDRTRSLPSNFPSEHLNEFPYHFPVVFRSGPFVIHRVTKSVAPLNPDFMALSSR